MLCNSVWTEVLPEDLATLPPELTVRRKDKAPFPSGAAELCHHFVEQVGGEMTHKRTMLKLGLLAYRTDRFSTSSVAVSKSPTISIVLPNASNDMRFPDIC